MDLQAQIKEIEDRIEAALWNLELHKKLAEAQAVYLEAGSSLLALGISAGDLAYPEQQRVLSYCLMRQGNFLRQTGKPGEALALSERELSAARASGNELMLARSLMSNGTNLFVTGNTEKGLEYLDEARALFEKKDDDEEYCQGLGWYWILLADLANAGMVHREPLEVIAIADRARELLLPIENWPGVARAFAARARAYENLGSQLQAARDRKEQEYYESLPAPRDEAQE